MRCLLTTSGLTLKLQLNASDDIVDTGCAACIEVNISSNELLMSIKGPKCCNCVLLSAITPSIGCSRGQMLTDYLSRYFMFFTAVIKAILVSSIPSTCRSRSSASKSKSRS